MILVTGGTGLVGSHLLFHLITNKEPVKATYRKGSNLSKVEKVFSYYTSNFKELYQKINWVEADINDVPALEIAFEQITKVYHCAALISFDPKKLKNLYKINVEGTANIVNFCIAKNIKKLCYISSIATIGRGNDLSTSTEETEWNDVDANVYALSKYNAEMEVWRGTQENLPVVIVNPGVIIGPGFWNTGSGILFKTAAKGRNYYPPGGTGFITVNDVVKMVSQLMNTTTINQRYIAVSKNYTYKEILSKITHELSINPPTKELKFWQLEILRYLDSLLNLVTSEGRKITKSSIHGLKNRQLFSTKKIAEELNFKYEVIDNILKFCCAIYKEENKK